MAQESLSQTVDGFLFEFTFESLHRSADGIHFDFKFEVCTKNHTGGSVQIVSRLVRIYDGSDTEVHKKNSAIRNAVQLNPGDTLKFEGVCPLPNPVGSVECEIVVKGSDGKPRRICSPRFQMTFKEFLH